jgi:hypothetical protein
MPHKTFDTDEKRVNAWLFFLEADKKYNFCLRCKSQKSSARNFKLTKKLHS